MVGDLSWLDDAPGFLIVIDAADEFLIESDDDLSWFCTVVGRTAQRWTVAEDEDEEWGRSAKPFHIALRGAGTADGTWVDRWRTAGALSAGSGR